MDFVTFLSGKLDLPSLERERRMEQQTHVHHDRPLACVNDIRHVQNKKNPLPLTALANITIHDNIVKWSGTGDPSQFIFHLNLPTSLKVIVLIEYVSCEKHNFSGTSDSQNIQVLYSFPPQLQFISHNFFGYPPLHSFLLRYFSKSLWLLLFCENVLRIHGSRFILQQFSINNFSHSILSRLLRSDICVFPTRHCPELPLFTNNDHIQCINNAFYLKGYCLDIRRAVDDCPSRNFYTFSEWVKCNNKKYVKFSY